MEFDLFCGTRLFPEDEYQSCSGEEKTIFLIHEEAFNEQARSDDDSAGV